MRRMRIAVVVSSAVIAACQDSGTKAEESPTTNSDTAPVDPGEVRPTMLKLPDSALAVTMTRPALPARIAGDCPSPDRCEFGRTWRTCEAIPIFAEPKEGSQRLRDLKADETFTAVSGEIELVAPGKIRMLQASDPAKTGGIKLARTTMVEAYGPLQDSRALYYDPNSGKGWSPPAGDDHFWWDEKVAEMVEAPRMTWWLKIKAQGAEGWLRLPAVEDKRNFPSFYTKEKMQGWDVTITRDDESPDCATMLRPN